MKFIRVTSLLLFSAIITAFLSVPITTASYTIWLSSIEMPVTLNLFIASLIHDWFNLGVTLFLLFLAGFLIAFLITFIIRKIFTINLISEPFSYAIAGSVCILLILVLTVVLLFETQIIAGNRTAFGTFLHVLAGFAGGYFFGYFLKKM
ncbi:MAG: hypothetical protein ACJ0AM_01755 [Gammaproteobacteria bacterium]|tara:strand:- start:432 stop:878 length:447 start_codon:yes stop_codon:yes gene_type:complete